jgi:ElaB/YqjD/DUF883 family membrane-anchored ribosome-binding protein
MVDAPGGGEQQEILIKYTVDAEKAIEYVKIYKEATQELKVQIKEVAEVTKSSYKEAGEAVKAFTVGLDPKMMGQAATAAVKELQSETATASKQMATQAQQLAATEKASAEQRIAAEKRLTAEKRQAVKQREAETKQQIAAMKHLEREEKSATVATRGLGAQIQSLGDVAKIVFGTVFGLTAIGVLRQFTRVIGEAVRYGYELSKGMYQLGIGVNALRRSGIDITFQEVTQNIQALREEFGVFVYKDLVVGSATLLNLVRDMGFLGDQIFQLQRSIATLAVVNGRAMDDVQRTVALAISSGYTEGLQRLGVSINRVTIAQEAMRLGFEGGYMALNEQQRALATYNLILQKTAKYADDLQDYQFTLAGSIDASKAAIEDQKTAIGESLIPFHAILLKLAQGIIWIVTNLTAMGQALKGVGKGFDGLRLAADWLIDSFSIMKTEIGFWIEGTKMYIQELTGTVEEGGKEAKASVEELIESIEELGDEASGAQKRLQGVMILVHSIFDKAYREERGRESVERTRELIDSIKELGDEATTSQLLLMRLMEFANQITVGITGLEIQIDEVDISEADKLAEDISKVLEDLTDDMEDIWEGTAEKQKDIVEDLMRDIENIIERAQDRIFEMTVDYQDRIVEINRKAAYKIADAITRYNLDVQQAYADYYSALEDAQRDYKDREYQIEKDYEEKLQRLREEFLFALEDALRERDARQVLRLMRRYELDKEQAAREHEDEEEENKRRYEKQQEDLAKQRDERLRKLKEELDLRIQMIKDQAEREAHEEWLKYQAALAEQKRNAERQKEARLEQYEEQQEDLEEAIEKRLKAIAQALFDELKETEAGAQQIYNALAAYFGPGGHIERIMYYYRQMMSAYMGGIWGDSGTTTGGTGQKGDVGYYQHGGAFVASQPTAAVFGEAGPELVTITPMNKLEGAVGDVSGALGTADAQQSFMRLEIALTPGLEAEIVDKSLDQIADIILDRLS